MKYGEFRDYVLQLMDQYSSNGKILDNLYNDQSDYTLRIPALYNMAMMDITAFYKPLIDTFEVDIETEDIHDCHGRFGAHHTCAGHPDREWVLSYLPDNFVKMRPVLCYDNGRPYRSSRYYMVGDQLMIHRSLIGGILEYEREPIKLNTAPGADIEGINLDGDRQQQIAAAFYVAARLVMGDDAFAYTSFMNEYASYCSNMKSDMTAETVYNPDAYGFVGLNNFGVY